MDQDGTPSSSSDNEQHIPPEPIQMEDLSALSPAPVAIKQTKAPVVEVPVTAVMPQNKQDNLDLINISAESTPGIIVGTVS